MIMISDIVLIIIFLICIQLSLCYHHCSSILSKTSVRYNQFLHNSNNIIINKHNKQSSSNILADAKGVADVNYEDPGLGEFLAGPDKKKWRGDKSIMARKGQVPDEKYTPKDVVKIILSALQGMIIIIVIVIHQSQYHIINQL